MGRKNRHKRMKNTNNKLSVTSTSTSTTAPSGDAAGDNVDTTGGRSGVGVGGIDDFATNTLTGLVLRASIGVTVVGVSVGAYGLLSGAYTMDNSIQLFQNSVSNLFSSMIGGSSGGGSSSSGVFRFSSSLSSLSSGNIRSSSSLRISSSTLLISSTLMSGATAIVLGLCSHFPTQQQQQQQQSSSTATPMRCYHGSTVDNFADGSNYQKVVDKWYNFLKTNKKDNGDFDVTKFFIEHEYLRNDPQFITHLFAVATDFYLKNYKNLKNCHSDEDKYIMAKKLRDVLSLGIMMKYDNNYNFLDRAIGNKYLLDAETDRGVTKILARETISSSCRCMESHKSEAKRMKKLGCCHGCCQDFPRRKLQLCSRCLDAPYCSKKCMKKAWHNHKQFCTPYIKLEV